MAKIATLRRATAATAAAATTTYGESQMAVAFVEPATDEDTANSVSQNFAGLLTGPVDRASVVIINASNVSRVPQGAITLSGTTVTVADTGFVSTDRVIITAYATPLI